MDWLKHLLWHNDKFLGADWSVWAVMGWLGNAAFSSRFFVQWYATEKKGQVVIPVIFWWLSLIGSLLLLGYALVQGKDAIFIFAYAFAWIPYIRNLVIHYRHLSEQKNCSQCQAVSPRSANYCAHCGTKLG